MFAVGLPLESADSVAKEAKYEDCNETRSYLLYGIQAACNMINLEHAEERRLAEVQGKRQKGPLS
jgi:hypothetical protein